MTLEAINGILTVQRVAAENELHPTQLRQWKKPDLRYFRWEILLTPEGAGSHPQMAQIPQMFLWFALRCQRAIQEICGS